MTNNSYYSMPLFQIDRICSVIIKFDVDSFLFEFRNVSHSWLVLLSNFAIYWHRNIQRLSLKQQRCYALVETINFALIFVNNLFKHQWTVFVMLAILLIILETLKYFLVSMQLFTNFICTVAVVKQSQNETNTDVY